MRLLTCCFHCASWVCHPPTRTLARLLGPCYKTGELEAFRQRPEKCRSRRPPEGALLAPRSRPKHRRPPNGVRFSTQGTTHADQRPAVVRQSFTSAQNPRRTRCFYLLPSQQFQALFHSLFKVLFIFPSRYLFAIGLSPVFSLRRNLPPA